MYVEMLVPMCDFTDKMYVKPTLGAGALARGATGRWCVVMYMGPEYIKKHAVEPLSYDEAVSECEKQGGYVDF